MSFSVDVAIFPRDLSKITRKARRDIDRGITKGIGKAALLGKDIIDSRTKVGRGIDRAFGEYSDRYVTWLENNGYPSFPVDLEVTGDMMRSMQAKVTGSREAMIYFDNAFSAKKAAFNNETRPFFGFNDKEEKRMAAAFRKEIKL